MGKVVIKILQGSAVTLTKLRGLSIHPPVVNFLQCIRAKNYENWLAVDKVIAKNVRLTFFGPPCISTNKLPIVFQLFIVLAQPSISRVLLMCERPPTLWCNLPMCYKCSVNVLSRTSLQFKISLFKLFKVYLHLLQCLYKLFPCHFFSSVSAFDLSNSNAYISRFLLPYQQFSTTATRRPGPSVPNVFQEKLLGTWGRWN